MATGIAKFDGKCKKCGGEVRKHVTQIRWAPAQPGQSAHVECYYSNEVIVRDHNGKPLDGRKENVIPEIPVEEIAGLTVKTETLADGTLKVLSEERIYAKPANNTAEAGLMQLVAAGILPLIKDQINTKVDADAVKKIAEDAVLSCADMLREEFTTRIIIDNKNTGETKKIEGLVHKQFKEVLTWMKNGFNVYLGGEAGGGKTHLARQIAEALSMEFIPMQQSKTAFPTELKGYKTPDGKLMMSEFQRWAENGGLLYCAEYDAWSDNLKVLMNTALDNKFFPFPDGVKTLHANCYCIADGNTTGGGTATYSGRDSFDASVKQRFMFVAFTYDEKLERKLAHAHNPEAGVWVDWVQSVRRRAKTLNSRVVVSPRASIYGAKMLGQLPIQDIAEATIFWGADRDTVKSLIAENPYPSYPVS